MRLIDLLEQNEIVVLCFCFYFLNEMRSQVISLGREEKMLNSCLRDRQTSLVKEIQHTSEVPLEILVVMCFLQAQSAVLVQVENRCQELSLTRVGVSLVKYKGGSEGWRVFVREAL